MEVGGEDGSAKPAFEEGGVDDGGIGLEGHAGAEAVFEDAGDEGALVGLGDFFFDEGGEGNGTPEGGTGREVEEGGLLAETTNHDAEDGGRGAVLGEAVGVWEEEALEGGGMHGGRNEVGDEGGVAFFSGEDVWRGGEAGGFDSVGDVEDIEAFGNDDGVEKDVAADEAAVDFQGGGGVVEAVLSGTEAAMDEEAEEVEGEAGAEDAVLLEQGADLQRGGAGGNVDEALGGGAKGSEKEPAGEGGDGKEEEKDERQEAGVSAGLWGLAGARAGAHPCIVGGWVDCEREAGAMREGSGLEDSGQEGSGLEDSAPMPAVPRLMALDVGERRMGLAVTDGLGLTVQPLFTMARKGDRADAKWVGRLVRKHGVAEVVVGHPLRLDGGRSEQTARVEAFAAMLREFVEAPIHLHDERLSTRAAEEHLHRVRPGASLRGRKEREAMVDQVAAVVILEGFLEHRAHLRARAAVRGESPGG